MQKRKIVFLINPISGTAKKTNLRELIEKTVTEAKIPFEILDTDKEGNYGFLKEKVNKEEVTEVVICGGDGSINQVVSQLLDVNVIIGIIPMGSGNGLAYAAGIPMNSKKALDLILRRGTVGLIDAFRINEKFSCMLSGLGFDAQVAHDFAAEKRRGLMTYIKLTTKEFFKSKAYRFSIKSGSIFLKTEAFFISVANSNQFGNRITIAPQANLHDGLLDVVVVNKMAKIQMAFSMLWQIRAGKVSYPDTEKKKTGIHYFKTSKLTIENHQMAPLHIDGEPVETADTIEVNIIPGAFRLIQR